LLVSFTLDLHQPKWKYAFNQNHPYLH